MAKLPISTLIAEFAEGQRLTASKMKDLIDTFDGDDKELDAILREYIDTRDLYYFHMGQQYTDAEIASISTTTNYNELTNRPSINGTILQGNRNLPMYSDLVNMRTELEEYSDDEDTILYNKIEAEIANLSFPEHYKGILAKEEDLPAAVDYVAGDYFIIEDLNITAEGSQGQAILKAGDTAAENAWEILVYSTAYHLTTNDFMNITDVGGSDVLIAVNPQNKLDFDIGMQAINKVINSTIFQNTVNTAINTAIANALDGLDYQQILDDLPYAYTLTDTVPD
jgi:hypothetical protein